MVYDTPSLILTKANDDSSLEAIRSVVQVDELKNPVSVAGQVLAKVGKEEVLRHYRIANFQSTEDMLKLIAQKKGMIEVQKQEPASGKGKAKKVQVPNLEEAAKRVIRDFTNNRLTYFSQP